MIERWMPKDSADRNRFEDIMPLDFYRRSHEKYNKPHIMNIVKAGLVLGPAKGILDDYDYVKDLPNLVSEEEMNDLIIKYKENGDISVKRKIIAHNLRLLRTIVKEDFRLYGVSVDELIAVATAGLIKAIDTYQPERRHRFISHIRVCVEKEIFNTYGKIARVAKRANIKEYHKNIGKKVAGGWSSIDYFPDEQIVELVKKYKENNDHMARQKIIRHNTRLVVYTVKKYRNADVPLEDLISVGYIGLIKAIETFKIEKKTTFASYAARCIENEALMLLRKNKCLEKYENSFEENIDEKTPDVENLTIQEIAELREEKEELYKALYNNDFREEDIKIIEERYGLLYAGTEEKSQIEIGEKVHLSQSYVSRREKYMLFEIKKAITYP